LCGACVGSGQPASALDGLGVIEGWVSDPERSRPVWRANVYLRPATDTGWYEPAGAAEDSTRNVYTDSLGAYRLRGVVPGEYRLIARFPGFKAFRKVIRVRAGTVTRENPALRPLETGY